ncbi:ABC transporter substrate-binding protein [Insolitispirillum peregrinum]|uniref:Amino acid/amide ABC transporter substrate-binding protein, HAAT family n=1 Tax=Insolitispirillum peregrinum TaxID=80876 RepID=A0A1N7MLW1_9PROT|nr:ABC transporter substrate-binding protein [Insolitispirillum peregrinum]SIS87146.1 amino acid/amide ABC transporter substrate-binding protein, HAAT family [Insolitispirillum peregrinum]
MRGLFLFLLLVWSLSTPPMAQAEEALKIGWLGQAVEQPPLLANLPPPPDDEGLSGARLGVNDTNTTGKFLKLSYQLEEVSLPVDADPADGVRQLAARGVSLVVTGLTGEALDKALAAPEAAKMTFFNAFAADDRLRGPACRPNLLHTLPSRFMLADGLAQSMIVKKWTRWLLVTGPTPQDALFAAAIKRSAQRFGAKIVEEKRWTGDADLRRTAQTELIAFTRSKDYDVVVVSDEAGDFGDYLLFNTDLPRPVAGTQGLTPMAWHWLMETWGSGQLQNRFQDLAHRPMGSRDWAAWVAVRAVGEASVRKKTLDPAIIATTLHEPDFTVAGFKGVPLSFRPWNGQLRQPILVGWARALVTVSPQDGFLHPTNELDTLGLDRPESTCPQK